MICSNSSRFGGRGTAAGSRVQVGSTVETKTGTIIPTEQQVRWSGQGKFLANYVPDIDV
jgi:hypothetical protein